MYTLVLIRHGHSVWNAENRFTGWKDISLADQGIVEAKEAGRLLKEKGFLFDKAHTSLLKRAIKTLWLVLEELDLMWIDEQKDWRLNERHYGALQGLNKSETADKYGEEQVKIWRRSYSTPPPSLDVTDERNPKFDPRYASLNTSQIPLAECLADTVQRVKPYWEDVLKPEIKAGKKLLIVAHGNSIRAMIQMLDNLSEEAIMKVEIPTGIPLVYQLDANLSPLNSYYLGDQAAIEAAKKAVAEQGKASQV